MPERVVVTSALPYANGPIHFGHVVGAYLPADVYVRYRRMLGDDVHFVCGTDEHGVAITLKAEQEGQSYEAYVDHWHAEIRRALESLDIRFDVFTGTAHHRNPHHRPLVQQFFLDLLHNGYLLEKTEEQYLSRARDRFLPDRYIEGTCYLCGYEKARGDECPRCGRYLDAKKLVEPRSSLDGERPELRETHHWYLDLAKIRDEWLRGWFESVSGEWKPNVVNFVRADLDELRERPITRDLPWGVPIPLPGTEGKVLYVWFDAPIGYLSISAQHFASIGEPERFEQFWKDPRTELYHFIGKDNIVFHTVVFPSMLWGTRRGWIVPTNVPANEFFNLEGRKFNTSSGWYVAPESVAAFPADVLRYALCTMMPETADSEWTWSEFQSRVNDDLADNLGNFVTRTLRFVERFFEGRIPAAGAELPADRELFQCARRAAAEMQEALGRFQFRRACQALMALGNECNRYYDAAEPWISVKKADTLPRCRQTIRVCVEMIRALAVLSTPLLPTTARTLLGALGAGDAEARFEDVGVGCLPDGEIADAPLTSSFPKFRDDQGKEKTALFLKVEDALVESERRKLEALAAAVAGGSAAAAPAPPKEPLAAEVDFERFAAVDLRAGTIRRAERHPKADRLLVLEVDLGFEVRTVVAGVAEAYAPEELRGRRVVVAANLAPRKLRGVESRGMVLATDDASGKPRLLSPDPSAPDGARVR